MNRKRFALIGGIGCLVVIVLLAVIAVTLVVIPIQNQFALAQTTTPAPTLIPGLAGTEQAIPTFTSAPPTSVGPESLGIAPGSLEALYRQVNPGVVNVQVYIVSGGVTGQAAGSGFVLDEGGHIVTNNHVVADAQRVTVIFYNGIEAEAQIVGTDADSDLAVIQVDTLAEGAHSLPLGDSDQVQVGDWVIAIGNPFTLGGSMSLGIVSAVGRSIPSGVAGFVIPQAIQTDAAINPGNSGGPLLNLNGEVIGVNAQIATGGSQANAGVGFAIPVNLVRRVVPVLIQSGEYEWPWLGVKGTSVDLLIQQANHLPVQQGAYIDAVISGGPAEAANLQSSTGTTQLSGFNVPVGGDVVIEADGNAILNFDDLLSAISDKDPGQAIDLTILRNGQRVQITVTLEPRPASVSTQ
jgi:S1-C subfamily serine protease